MKRRKSTIHGAVGSENPNTAAPIRRLMTPATEQVQEARRQIIEWIGPEGGPLPTFGALSDLLEVSRQWLEDRGELLQ